MHHDEIHVVLKEPPPADFALLNSEKSGGGLVLILTNLTAGYSFSHASWQEMCQKMKLRRHLPVNGIILKAKSKYFNLFFWETAVQSA